MDTQPQEPRALEDLDLALYADGKLVPVEAVKRHTDGVQVEVTFLTTVHSLAGGAGDPREDRAWGGYEAGQLRYLKQPAQAGGARYPDAGCVTLESVIIPGNADEGVRFKARCITQVYDWDKRVALGAPGETITVPASWVEGGHA